jgi:type IV secretory pathway TrbL component
MANVKFTTILSRSLHLAVTALFVLSFAPKAWSDETAGAPPAADMGSEGVPPAPAADPGMGAGSPAEAPAEAPAPKKHKKAKHAAKKAKHAKKKSSGGKKKKKKKKHNNY